MTLPQLPREPVCPSLLGDEIDKEIWQPNWNCYCCHDTGLVRKLLVLLLIPDYDHHHDKPVVCQRRGCQISLDDRSSPHYDQRFDSDICAELDKISRDDWKQTVLDQHQLAKNRAAIEAAEKPLQWRLRKRISEESLEAQRRSEEIKANSSYCAEEESII